MLSSSPASSALCAVAPFFRRHDFDLQFVLCPEVALADHQHEAGIAFGSITPCFQVFNSCAAADARRVADKIATRLTHTRPTVIVDVQLRVGS